MLPILRPPKLDLEELVRIQERVAEQVVEEDRLEKLETIAGCDISFAEGDRACAACALLDYKSLKVLKQKVAAVKLKFPYIPTFLAFRELEGMLRVVRGIDADVYMVGAHGRAHPRRAGLACHLGVVLDKPTLGVAKGRLCGRAEEPPSRRGAYTLLKDDGKTIGAVLRTLPGSSPVYVSVGHKLSLSRAIEIALHTTRDHRLPEPLRIAHRLATLAMRSKCFKP
ncbi:MAG: endonuclease V [Hadesarchaea archaeon]|nr:endonuclease V [Hadesarchaea archaeon]